MHVKIHKDHAKETRSEDEARGSSDSGVHGIRDLMDQGMGLPKVDKMSMLQQDQYVESNQKETVRETVVIPVEELRTRDPTLLDS